MRAATAIALVQTPGPAGAVLASCVVVLGAWVRLTDAGLGCPTGRAATATCSPRPRTISPRPCTRWCTATSHRRWALIIVGAAGLGAAQSQAIPASRSLPVAVLFVRRVPARAARHEDGDAAAAAADRDGASARRAHRRWASCAGCRSSRSGARRRSGRLRAAARSRSLGLRVLALQICSRRLDQHQLRGRGLPGSADLPARPGGRTWISATRSCCGAGSASTTRAACLPTRRAWRFISRIDSARSSPGSTLVGVGTSRVLRSSAASGARWAGGAADPRGAAADRRSASSTVHLGRAAAARDPAQRRRGFSGYRSW